MSYIILRGRWYDIIFLNVHAPTEDKINDMKDSFYEEQELVFDKFPKYHTEAVLGDFNVKVGREDIFKSTIGNEILHEISNDNRIRVVNFAASKKLLSKVRCSHIVTFVNLLGHPDRKTHNQIDHILIDRRRHSSVLDIGIMKYDDQHM
jgi:hypothetical protein